LGSRIALDISDLKAAGNRTLDSREAALERSPLPALNLPNGPRKPLLFNKGFSPGGRSLHPNPFFPQPGKPWVALSKTHSPSGAKEGSYWDYVIKARLLSAALFGQRAECFCIAKMICTRPTANFASL
jgi:hypothetical protein